jgi:hypothetical protein
MIEQDNRRIECTVTVTLMTHKPACPSWRPRHRSVIAANIDATHGSEAWL